MSVRRSSGLDFKDRSPFIDQNPFVDGTGATPPSHLQRNKSERTRLQGIQKPLPKDALVPARALDGPRTFGQWFDLWMINEGSKRIFFSVWIFFHMLVIAFGFMNYEISDDYKGARATFGVTYAIARSAALVLHTDIIFILLPVCRNFISLLRRTPLNQFIPFDKNIAFHKATAWSIVIFAAIHIGAHMRNFYELALADPNATTSGKRVLVFLQINLATGPGATGWIMTAALAIMVWFSMEKRRSANFEKFWYTHHLFVVFFLAWQLHGVWCMVKPDREPFCSFNNIGVFWKYWLIGGLIWTYERILREVRSRHKTYISKVIQHPSNVMEIQIKKEKTTTRPGQYIFISCPEISYFQWHPFTLTSAPEEDYISVHIRVIGDFTTALAKAVGCEFESRDVETSSGMVVGTSANPPLNRVLPRIMVDGPFGSASEDFLNYETILLVGAGIGVTPFASILKSIWYRMNNVNSSKPTRLSKVYFTWVIRDFGSAEWFHSLLQAIEEQDMEERIEINIYLTASIKDDDVNNIIVQDVGADKDAITTLRAPTHFGRPNWDRVFSSIVDRHPETDVGVFLCGPPLLSRQLHQMCNKYSVSKGTRFFFGQENF